MDRRAQRIGAQRRQKHLERREQLAVQIEEGEQLVAEFRAELTALQSAAERQRAVVDGLDRAAARARKEVEAQRQELKEAARSLQEHRSLVVEEKIALASLQKQSDAASADLRARADETAALARRCSVAQTELVQHTDLLARLRGEVRQIEDLQAARAAAQKAKAELAQSRQQTLVLQARINRLEVALETSEVVAQSAEAAAAEIVSNQTALTMEVQAAATRTAVAEREVFAIEAQLHEARCSQKDAHGVADVATAAAAQAAVQLVAAVAVAHADVDEKLAAETKARAEADEAAARANAAARTAQCREQAAMASAERAEDASARAVAQQQAAEGAATAAEQAAIQQLRNQADELDVAATALATAERGRRTAESRSIQLQAELDAVKLELTDKTEHLREAAVLLAAAESRIARREADFEKQQQTNAKQHLPANQEHGSDVLKALSTTLEGESSWSIAQNAATAVLAAGDDYATIARVAAAAASELGDSSKTS